MGRTLTDFSQLSKGMFKKSDPVVEVKPLPPKKAAGDDALAYFGLNAPEAPTRAPGVRADNGRIQSLEANVAALRAESAALAAAKAEAESKSADLQQQLAAERQARASAETERDRLRGEVLRLKNELEDALTAPHTQPVEAEPVREVRVAGLLKPPQGAEADNQGHRLVRRRPHNRRAGEVGFQVRLGQQALEARLRQCPHPDLENPVRPPWRTEHGNGHSKQVLLMILRHRRSMKNLLTILVAAVGMQASARTVVVPTMPVSPYADTEVSTNVAINIAQISYSDLEFHFSGTPTNNLELAFGTDVNTNGVLDAEEVETRFGWRSGRYFMENALTWERFVSEPASGAQNLSVELHLDIRYALQQVKRVNVTGTNASAFGELVSGASPAWLWRREWNLMRATRRGTEPPSDWLEYKSGHYGFSLRLR